MLEALLGLTADVHEGYLSIAPTKHEGEEFNLPAFLPYAWFEVNVTADGSKMTISPIKSIKPCLFNKLRVKGNWKLEGADCSYSDGYTHISSKFDAGIDTLTLLKN